MTWTASHTSRADGYTGYKLTAPDGTTTETGLIRSTEAAFQAWPDGDTRPRWLCRELSVTALLARLATLGPAGHQRCPRSHAGTPHAAHTWRPWSASSGGGCWEELSGVDPTPGDARHCDGRVQGGGRP